MLIEKLFNDVELFFQGKHEEKETHYFAFYVQDYLCDNYDEMYKENAEVTEFLNEDLPEITDIAEYGDDKRNEEFKRRLKIEIDKTKELFYKGKIE